MLRENYDRFVALLRIHHDIAAALRLLEWDQETYMPAGAIASRARQIGTLAEILHQHQTAPRFLGLMDELSDRIGELSDEEAVDVRETKWRIDRQRALPSDFVRRRSSLHARARAVWVEARKADDFGLLAPFLDEIFRVERELAKIIDAQRPPYDVLLDAYEPGATTAEISDLFVTLGQGLAPLIERVRICAESPGGHMVTALRGNFPVDIQRRLNREVAACLGFDFTRGRLDEAAHPFSTDIGADIRITTRYDEADLSYALYSTIHETGHALYEQGLLPEALGLPRGTSCSLGVHESQSRFWENLIGRSEAFWSYLLPVARNHFPALEDVSLRDVLSAVNEARPSLIRTESDEITYNLHIILRFELERDLIDDRLRVADLPAAWSDGMQRNLGIRPPNDREGVLQDVHWACGALGYFPTYSLGNLYAAQLMEAIEQSVGPCGALVERGDFRPLLDWLRHHIHRQGQRYRAPELVRRATGKKVTAVPLLSHLERRVSWLETRE